MLKNSQSSVGKVILSAIRLKEELKASQPDITLKEALRLISASHGYESWNRLSTLLRNWETQRSLNLTGAPKRNYIDSLEALPKVVYLGTEETEGVRCVQLILDESFQNAINVAHSKAIQSKEGIGVEELPDACWLGRGIPGEESLTFISVDTERRIQLVSKSERLSEFSVLTTGVELSIASSDAQLRGLSFAEVDVKRKPYKSKRNPGDLRLKPEEPEITTFSLLDIPLRKSSERNRLS